MRKYLLILIAAALLATGTASFAADSSYLNLIGGIGAGYYDLLPKDIQVSSFYNGGITYRGFLGFKAESGVSAIADISYFSQGNMSPTAPFGTALTIVPVTASVSYHPLKDTSISPYFGAGIGVYFINEKDPDISYLQTTVFGKHIFAGADIYVDRGTIIRAEIRQTFIDPVNSTLYYQSSFGGLTASVNIAMEIPLFGKETPLTPEEAAALQQRSIASDEHQAILNRLDDINSYYDPYSWNNAMYYNPWNSPTVYINTVVQPTQGQVDEQKASAQQAKSEQAKKQQDYIDQKLQLRQDKKQLVNPSR